MSIKMVCSDIDGTLLPYGQKSLSCEIFSLIRTLASRGIVFCPTSGRQYTSLRKLFAPVAEHCVFLCDNGGVIYKNDKCIAKNTLPRQLAEDIANDMWYHSENQGEVMIAGQNTAYLMVRDLGIQQHIQFGGNNYKIIHDPSEVPEDIVKVSVYLHEGAQLYAERFLPRWKHANCTIAGPHWIDAGLSSKGAAITTLCELEGISPAEVMAFGDNYNDVSMLDLVGHPYIMERADRELLTRYVNHTKRPEDVLSSFLALS